MDDNGKISGLHQRLKDLRECIPGDPELKEKYIQEFHAILGEFNLVAHVDIQELRIPDSQIFRPVVTPSFLPGESVYSDYWQCDRRLFIEKLDTTLRKIQELDKAHPDLP